MVRPSGRVGACRLRRRKQGSCGTVSPWWSPSPRSLVAWVSQPAPARRQAEPGATSCAEGLCGQPAAVAHAQVKAQHAQIGFVYGAAIKGYSATLSSAAVDALRSDPRVAAVVADRPVHLEAQRLPTGINRVDGERSSTVSGNGTGSVSVDIAIIDTGIDTNHPDLNVVGGVACNGSGYEDRNGHGTHVAGIAAARDNATGVVGVAPGARLWAVRLLDASGAGSWSNVICGVDWVTRNAGRIEVANMSLGGSGSKPSRSGCSTGNPPLYAM